MAFDFQGTNPYLSDETRRVLEMLFRQNQQPEIAQTEQSAQPVQQAEQPSGTDIVNRAVESALPQRPSYLLPQAPNPLQNQYEQAILAQKILYDAAQKQYEATQDDAARQGLLANMEAIYRQANSTRDIGTAAGMDLSNVGEGVSLQDAIKNLQSKQAQDLMQMTTGRYSMTADQFFESEYDRHRMAGSSDETARRRASRAAREYQANRVAYLNSLYNSYGRDGLVTNELGNQILLNLAADSPTSANFYGQIYPNAKDAYARQNKLEDDERTQANNRSNMVLDALLRDQIGSNADVRGRATFGYQQQILYANQMALENFKNAHKDANPDDVEKAWQEGLHFATINGYAGEQAIDIARQYTNRKLFSDGKGKGADKSVEQMTARYNSLLTRQKNLYERLKDAGSDKEREAIQNELAEVQTLIKDLDAQFSEVHGGEATKLKPIPPYTGNSNQDLETARLILGMILKTNPNATREQIVQSFKEWIKDKDSANSNMPDWAIEKWVDEVVYGKQDAPPQSTAQQAPRQDTPKATEPKPRKPNDKPVGVRPWETPTPLNQFNNPTPNHKTKTNTANPTGSWDDYSKYYGYYRGWR